MKARLMFAFALALLLLMPSVCAADLSSADEPQEETSTFSEHIPNSIMSGIDAVSDAVSVRADSAVLPAGATSVIGAVVDGETSEPQTPETPVPYHSDTEIDELLVSGGDTVSVDDGVTVTVHTLYIESAGTPISFSTGSTGKMVIGVLVIEGFIIPMANTSVQAESASVVSSYQVNGQEKNFSMTVTYTNHLRIGIGDYTVVYSSDDPAEIEITVGIDLTGYVSHITAPGALSTIDRLIRYIGSLDLIKFDVEIRVGGTYGIEDYPLPFSISDMELTINSHKNEDPAYYSIALSIGENVTYPVHITSISISMDLPASRMSDGSRPSMDRSRVFSLTADSIEVERVEPDDPLSVRVEDLSIEMASEPDPELAMSMSSMVYRETVTDKTGTHDVGTTVTGFDMDFKGTASDLLDNAKEMIKKVIRGETVEGGLTLGGIDYRSYESDGITVAEQATITGISVKASVALIRFGISVEVGPFVYKDKTRNLSSDGIGYDFWIGLNPSFDPGSVTKLRDILKLLEVRSVAKITADGDGDYTFKIDKFRRFITYFTTDGLRVTCGDDILTLDRLSVTGLPSDPEAVFSYHRLTGDEIKDKVPGSVRNRLNGGEVIELTNSLGKEKLDGSVEISVKTDLSSDRSGAYYINKMTNKLEDRESTLADGHMTFKTDTMGLHAVTGPLKVPGRAALAWGLLSGAAVLGLVTVLVGRRFIARGL